MKGLLFIQIQQVQLPGSDQKTLNIKLGVVKDQLGPDRILCKFNGPKFSFSAVVPAQELGSFMFFDSEADRQSCLQSMTPPTPPPPPVEAPPAPAEAPLSPVSDVTL